MSQEVIEAILDEHIVVAEIIDEYIALAEINEDYNSVLLVEMAFLQGVPGAPGAKGDKGDPGDVGGSLPWANILGKPILDFVYDQTTASTVWLITHNMGRVPSVIIIDTAGNRWIADELHLSLNLVRLEFTAAFAGKAYLN